MEFNPNNHVIKCCIRAMALEENGEFEEAKDLFLLAWNEATDDFEKFIAAYYVARHQNKVSDTLQWYVITLQFASKINDAAVEAAFPLIYSNIAKCYEQLGDPDKAKMNYQFANSHEGKPSDKGPFYHGTKADLQVGDLLTAGSRSNYKAEVIMNHIYFTALVNGAGLAAALANGDGNERVYVVEPTGDFENDPNVTNKKFPGNPSRSYRSREPIKIIGEITDWVRQTPEELKKWQEKLANNKGEIIN